MLTDKKPDKLTLKVAAAICRAEGEYRWRFLKAIQSNPSTGYAYYNYLKMAKAAIRATGVNRPQKRTIAPPTDKGEQ